MRDAGQARLDEALNEALRRARAAFTTLLSDDACLTEALRARVRDQPDPLAALAALEVPELVLADACARGDAGALAILEQRYLPDVRATFARVGLRDADVDEAEQLLRAELLIPVGGKGARIAGYAGRSHLRGYLRAIGGRIALRLVKRRRVDEPLDSQAQAVGGDDLEIAFLKKTYGAVFNAAFRVALAELPGADRLLLTQRLVHALSLADLGALHGVHLSTMSRRVSDARARLVDATREEMMRRLGATRAEVSSLLRLIHSQMEITLSSVAGADGDVP